MHAGYRMLVLGLGPVHVLEEAKLMSVESHHLCHKLYNSLVPAFFYEPILKSLIAKVAEIVKLV